jgi:hypothetical protein
MITEVVLKQRDGQARTGGLLTSVDVTDDGDGGFAI